MKRMEANPAISELEIEGFKTYLSYHERILRSIEEGKPLVLYNFSLSPEIFEAMDVQPLQITDFIRATAGVSLDAVLEINDIAEGTWLPATTCGLFKMTVGAVVSDKMPKPDLIIAGAHPCDAAIAGYSRTNHDRRPGFCRKIACPPNGEYPH